MVFDYADHDLKGLMAINPKFTEAQVCAACGHVGAGVGRCAGPPCEVPPSGERAGQVHHAAAAQGAGLRARRRCAAPRHQGGVLELVLSWSSAGPQLVLSWSSAGPQLDLSWSSAGPQLVLSWSSAGPQLVLSWTSAGPQLVLSWTSAGPQLTPPWFVTAAASQHPD
jgi:hypothetical protein